MAPTFGEKVGAVGIKSPGRLLPHPRAGAIPRVVGGGGMALFNQSFCLWGVWEAVSGV